MSIHDHLSSLAYLRELVNHYFLSGKERNLTTLDDRDGVMMTGKGRSRAQSLRAEARRRERGQSAPASLGLQAAPASEQVKASSAPRALKSSPEPLVGQILGKQRSRNLAEVTQQAPSGRSPASRTVFAQPAKRRQEERCRSLAEATRRAPSGWHHDAEHSERTTPGKQEAAELHYTADLQMSFPSALQSQKPAPSEQATAARSDAPSAEPADRDTGQQKRVRSDAGDAVADAGCAKRPRPNMICAQTVLSPGSDDAPGTGAASMELLGSDEAVRSEAQGHQESDASIVTRMSPTDASQSVPCSSPADPHGSSSEVPHPTSAAVSEEATERICRTSAGDLPAVEAVHGSVPEADKSAAMGDEEQVKQQDKQRPSGRRKSAQPPASQEDDAHKQRLLEALETFQDACLHRSLFCE